MSTAELDIRIRSGDVPNATKELQRLERQGATTERGIAGLTSGFGKLASAAAGLASISAAMNKLVSTARQFDQLNAGLLTMTGSSENAAIAFAELEKFAAKTPYTLDQSVQGFTKLVALGLNPSQRAMESYGNTAAAMGKDLSQMIEAVADAATGEFERLKEFGIKSKQQGDRVSFTFQGVTTTVGKNAAEIEGYLQSLGENQFAGAMANRMNTLDGALSNLQDSWDGLFRSISSQGAGQEIEQGVRVAIGALDELTAMISSGELTANIKAWGGQWQATMQDVATMLDGLDSLFTGVMNDWGVKGEDAAGVLGRAFSEFPANIRASIQIATTYLAGFIDKVGVYAGAASALLDPRNMFTSIHKTLEPYKQELEQIDNTVMGLNVGYLNQRDTAIQSFSQQTEAAKKMRAEFDLIKNGTSADLGQFKAGGSTGGGDAVAADPKAAQAAKAAKRAYDAKISALAREQQAEADDYQKRLASAGEFNARMEALNASELDKARNERGQRMIENQAAYNNNLISEGQYQLNLSAIKQRYEADRTAIQKQELEKQRQLASDSANILIQQTQFMTGTVADMLRDSGKENSGLMQGMLAAQKALAIPSIIVSTEQAAAAAMAHESLLGGLLSGTMAANIIRAQGAISAGIVAGQAIGGFAGMFDNGGNIGSGQWGIVGENGPEIVKGPANVTSRKKTAAMAAGAMEGGSGGNVYNITQNIQGNGDQALAEVVDRATKNALNEVQRDFATNGRIRKTAGV